MEDFDEMLAGALSEEESRRFRHWAMAADVEDVLTELERKIWLAVEQSCADGEPNKHVHLLKRLAEFREQVNILWAEIEKPFPDYSVFYT